MSHYQSCEPGNVNTSEQAPLHSTNTLIVSPIMEEVAGVETDSPTTNLEVDSPNQQPRLQADGVDDNPSRKDGDQTLAEGLSLEIHADQPNATTGGHNVDSGKASKSDENLSKYALPTAKIHTTSMAISQEEFDQLEKANPLAAFGLMLKMVHSSPKVLGFLQILLLMIPQRLREKTSWRNFEAKCWKWTCFTP